MRLLLLNPNTTAAMTERMTEVARGIVGARVEILPRTATRGVPYIASRAEAQIAGAEVLDMLAQEAAGADAAVIAAFGDPGIVAAREVFDMPIVGMAEAAVMSAALLGERFAVVTFSPEMERWYVECVAQTGLSSRFAGVFCPDDRPERLDTVAEDHRDALIGLAAEATGRGGADVVIIGGAPLAGLAPQIAAETPGILVDPIAAAVVQAMGLAQLRPSFGNRPRRPVTKTSTGLSPALASLLSGGTP
ncbi:MAG: aspartate/glutamate racemase family protein [Pseudomonadota bacterium]